MEKQSGGRRRCAFCGRTEDQVLFLIPSRTGLYICDGCVEDCQALIDEQLSKYGFTVGNPREDARRGRRVRDRAGRREGSLVGRGLQSL